MATYNDTLTEIVNALDGVPDGIYAIPITENIQVSDTYVLQEIAQILEDLGFSDTLTTRGNLTVLAIEGIQTNDTIFISFPISVVEALEISGTLVVSKAGFMEIMDDLEIAESLVGTGVYVTTTSESIEITSVNDRFFSKTIAENLAFDDTLVIERITLGSSSENVEVSDTNAGQVSYIIGVVASALASDTLGSQASLTMDLSENMDITDMMARADEIDTYVMNPENYAVSKYLFGFTESAVFDNSYLFANGSGLYELGGTDDNGDAIVATVQTAALDLGTSNIKQMPQVLLGTNGTSVVLSVSVDGSYTATYEITERSSALMTKHIKLGKGLIGKYWQFELVSDSTDFDLDSFEFYPVIFKRKHNG